MDTFEKYLMDNFDIWNNKTFIKEQLLNHLDEVKELVISGESHQNDELIDLIVISKIMLFKNLDSKELSKKLKDRQKKFISKTENN